MKIYKKLKNQKRFSSYFPAFPSVSPIVITVFLFLYFIRVIIVVRSRLYLGWPTYHVDHPKLNARGNPYPRPYPLKGNPPQHYLPLSKTSNPLRTINNIPFTCKLNVQCVTKKCLPPMHNYRFQWLSIAQPWEVVEKCKYLWTNTCLLFAVTPPDVRSLYPNA